MIPSFLQTIKVPKNAIQGSVLSALLQQTDTYHLNLVTIAMNAFQILADVAALVLTIRRSMHIREGALLFAGTFRLTEFFVQDG